MASYSTTPCGPCTYEGITKQAKKWCTSCEEGFCEDCEQSHKSLKLTRDHKMIAIENYLKIQDVSVNLNCMTHGKKLDLYCKYHGVAVCAVCVPAAHKTCRADDIISIDDAAKNAKYSTALTDLEETISRTLDNLRQSILDRTKTSTNIDTDTKIMKNRILETRLKLNKHLDALEENILQELRTKHDKCKSKYSETLKCLKKTEHEFAICKEQTQQMKLFASDLQVFLGTCQMNETTMEKIKSLKAETCKDKSYAMDMKLHPVFYSLLNDVEHFGEIHITENNFDQHFKEEKIKQAQKPIRGLSQNIGDINLEIKLDFLTKPQTLITGCLISSSGRILLADFFGTGNLMEYEDTGKYVRTIQISSKPFDLIEIDTDHIVVTYPEAKKMEFMNLKGNNVERKIECRNKCYGISLHNRTIFTLVRDRGILIIDITGTILETINIITSSVYFITATEDKIYYTDEKKNTVNCCNFKGKLVWSFSDKSIFWPTGITVDKNHNVYVVGNKTKKLVLIQNDGKKSKVIFNAKNGLFRPLTVCYNKNKNLLLLNLESGRMAMYHVT
ncbi:unnamed protein product [Mytilus edulis]|uniref:B box-type domain-containing protein n=1 Tax=Mytilus edulis TaxID=6550 RepID=A0A8S3SRD6_MYTED|nr:unnamed protein product [Mytilus edulis]